MWIPTEVHGAFAWAALAAAAVEAVGQWWANKTNKRLSGNRWQTAVNDMRRAGLNPALAYSQGPAPMPVQGNVGEAAVSGFERTSSAMAHSRQARSQEQMQAAQTRYTNQLALTEEQRTKRAAWDSDSAKMDFEWMTDSYQDRLNEVPARVKALGAQAGLSSAQQNASEQQAKQLVAETAYKRSLKDLTDANREAVTYDLKQQRGFSELFGPEDWKRYLMSVAGSAIGGGAQAFRNVMSPMGRR